MRGPGRDRRGPVRVLAGEERKPGNCGMDACAAWGKGGESSNGSRGSWSRTGPRGLGGGEDRGRGGGLRGHGWEVLYMCVERGGVRQGRGGRAASVGGGKGQGGQDLGGGSESCWNAGRGRWTVYFSESRIGNGECECRCRIERKVGRRGEGHHFLMRLVKLRGE